MFRTIQKYALITSYRRLWGLFKLMGLIFPLAGRKNYMGNTFYKYGWRNGYI